MDISAQNTFTPATLVHGESDFDVLIAGTFVADVVVQVSRDETTWYDVKTYTAPVVETGDLGSTWYVRAGVKTGGYTSGTATVVIV